jgi:hypothetical protein
VRRRTEAIARLVVCWLNEIYLETRGGPRAIERGVVVRSGEGNPKATDAVGKSGLTEWRTDSEQRPD